MTRTWLPDPGWTGSWVLPAALKQPLLERERGGLVALSCAGMGPARLAEAIAKVDRVDTVLGGFAARSKSALGMLSRLGARAVVPSDDEYPDQLAAIDAPPPLLFVRGRPLNELRPAVAIVGARACTTGAGRFAGRLGASFAEAGLVVVSGLARGIDAAAHHGALREGSTVAVLGTGIDVCYPAEHLELAGRIASSGAIVTEFPPGIGPRAWHFPSRNRIISGLAIAVVIVEAGTRSGALITAGFALDQGREVFACTTGPENPAGAGVRELLKDGARLIVDPDQAVADVLDLAQMQGHCAPVRATDELDLKGDLRLVYEATTEGTTIDHITTTSGLDVKRVSSLLSELELDGYVECEGSRWRRLERRIVRT